MITYESIANTVYQTKGLLNKHDETKLLFDLASNVPNGCNILEIGSYCGLSSICLAYGALNSNNKLYCITQWQNDISLIWRSNVYQNGLNATVIYGDANNILNNIKFDRLSLVFIDAEHKYFDVQTQFTAIKPSLIHNAIVAFHDYGRQYPDIKKYCDELVVNQELIDTNMIHCTFYGKVPSYQNWYH